MSYIAKLLLADVQGLIERGDIDGLAVACRSLAGEIASGAAKLDTEQTGRLLKSLKSKRQFTALIELASALEATGAADDRTRQLKAQALLDTGRLDDAIVLLDALAAKLPKDSEAFREVCGNLGRAWKQRYVDAANAEPSVRNAAALQQAISHYGMVVALGDLKRDHWHVINFIACTARAERDGIDPGHTLASVEIARRLILELEPAVADPASTDIWRLASLGEAHVACGEFPQATAVYRRYAGSPGVDAFEIFSSMRQLIEVWRLKREGAAAEIIALLERRFGEVMDGGTVLGGVDAARLERMNDLLGARTRYSTVATAVADATGSGERAISPLLDVEYLARLLRRSRSVGRIVRRMDDGHVGAGFLVRGGDVHPTFSDTILLLTNNHVVSRRGTGEQPAAVRVEFMSGAADVVDVRFTDDDVVWESPVQALDTTLIRLPTAPAGFEPQPLCRQQSLPDDIGRLPPAARLCHFIGPARDLKIRSTIQPSAICDLGWREGGPVDHVFIHHDTETRDGSSGSPLFDMDWTVIGVHRASAGASGLLRALGGRVGGQVARQAVSINSIRAQIAADLAGDLAADRVAGAAPAPTPLRLSAAEVLALVESDTTDEETLDRYFIVDEQRSQPFNPVLMMRPMADDTQPEASVADAMFGVLATGASTGLRRLRNRHFAPKPADGSGLTLISDGDSWFQFPVPGVADTIDHLQKTHAIYCHAVAGTTLQDWAAQVNGRILPSVAMYRPDGVLLSGGGNDLLGFGGISNFIANYSRGATAEDLVKPVLDDQIAVMVQLYARIVGDIAAAHPKLKIFCHGYDWALPAEPKGGWLYRPLATQRGIADVTLQRQIVKILIDRFNVRMKALETQFPGILHFVDCRGAIGDSRSAWWDELHPRSPGFGRVAARFNRRIAEAFDGDRRVIGIA